jgi:transcriptional regulator with XRE-family HTH domain
MSQISSLIKEIREKSGKTQNEISKILGYKNAQFISNVEREMCSFPPRKVKQFIYNFGGSRKEFIDAYIADYKNELERTIGEIYDFGKELTKKP